MNDKITLLIFSCDKFSDLWSGHIKLLNMNWPDRDMRTLIITDTNSKGYSFEGVEILAVGENVEWSDRLAYALDNVTTKYVFVTLDDYYPVNKIDTNKIDRLVNIAETENLDYIRLFHRPWSHIHFADYKNLYKVDLYDDEYAVNLYAGIWNKAFMRKTVQEPLNAWQFEVSLTKVARKLNAKCAMSKGKEFETLDVVRKGKILRKANRYFNKNPEIYTGDREIVPLGYNAFIEIRTIAKKLLPSKFVDFLKNIGRKHGMTFYTK